MDMSTALIIVFSLVIVVWAVVLGVALFRRHKALEEAHGGATEEDAVLWHEMREDLVRHPDDLEIDPDVVTWFDELDKAQAHLAEFWASLDLDTFAGGPEWRTYRPDLEVESFEELQEMVSGEFPLVCAS